MPDLFGFLDLFAFEENNSCLIKFFIQKITSKIFTPVNSILSRGEERGRVHPSIPHCGPKTRSKSCKFCGTNFRDQIYVANFTEFIYVHLLSCPFKRMFMKLCDKTIMLFCFFYFFYICSTITVRRPEISEGKLNFAKQISAMERIWIILAGFNFAVWVQNCKSKFDDICSPEISDSQKFYQ